MRILRSQYQKFKKDNAAGPVTSKGSKTNQSLSFQFKGVEQSSSQLCSDLPKSAPSNTNLHDISDGTPVIKRPFRSRSVLTQNVEETIKSSSSKPPLSRSRRSTVYSDTNETSLKDIKIKLINARQYKGTVNVVLHFYKESPGWYTDFYRSYEGDLWERIRRVPPTKKSKWFFLCNTCGNSVASFGRIKAHMNLHFGFFPNNCVDCPKKYPSRQSLMRHRKVNHTVDVR